MVINHHVQMKRKDRQVEFVLQGIPKNPESNTPESEVLKDLRKNIIEPLGKIMLTYRQKHALPIPKVRLEFNEEKPAQYALENETQEANTFFVETPTCTLDDVVLPKRTRKHIESVLKLISHHDLIYNRWNLKSTMGKHQGITLNFWGKPGTGKTLSASAIAGTLGKEIIIVNCSELESKYVGDTGKNIQRVFKSAKGKVLFFDEADALLGKRLSNISQAADHGINASRSAMLIELERFNGIAIFATNLVSNYDTAFSRRLLHQVEFELPDKHARQQIFKKHIPAELPINHDVTEEWLADNSEGLSGGEIKNVVLKMAAKCAFENPEGKITQKHAMESFEEVRKTLQQVTSDSQSELWFKEKMKNSVGR